MTAFIRKISVGAEGKHTLSPEESLCRSLSFGKVLIKRRQNVANKLFISCYFNGRLSFHPIPCGSRDRPVGRKSIDEGSMC